ncbi:glycosyltransferase family 2 protein [Dickeya dadantii]|nr:glycosyltransferase family 2 protein [Dickeya dadantii]
MNHDVFAVIVTYHPDDGLGERLLAVKEQVDSIMVFDNSEKPEAIMCIKEMCDSYGVFYIGDGENHGIAHSLNVGAKYAKDNGFKYYLTFDQDSKVPDNYVSDMVDAIEKDDNIGIIGPMYLDVNDGRLSRFPVKDGFFIKRKTFHSGNDIYDVMCIITSGALCKVSVFSKVGFFIDEYFIDYVDNEFCLRLLASGFRVCVYSNVTIRHALGNRSKRFGFSPTNYPYYRKYYVTRNRLDVWKKYIRRYPSFVLYDSSAFFLDLFRVVFFEKNKYIKIKAMIIGGCDFLKGKYGKLSGM